MIDVDAVLSAHDRHHDRLRELLFALLECLVVVDVDRAQSSFDRFVAELRAGLALEDELVLPAYRPLQPGQGPGRVDHVEGDHVILERGIGFVAVLLEDVARVPTLRTVLEGLPHVYRLLGTLEHHGERERRHVYPVAIAALGEVERQRLGVALRRLVDDSPLP